MPRKITEHRRAIVRKAAKVFYANHREKIIAAQYEKNKKTRERNQKFIIAYKKNHPCADCGHTHHFSCMEFDHQKHRGAKREAISVLVNNMASLKTLMAEIEKCDLVCANCHRVRTWKRLQAAKKKRRATG